MSDPFDREDDLQLFQRFQEGDVKAGDDIVAKHMGLVKSYVYSITRRDMSIVLQDDLVQSGVEGLVRARNEFDVRRSIKFSTFAYYMVRKYVNEARIKERQYRARHELSDADCSEGETFATLEWTDINGGYEDFSPDEAILYSDLKTILSTREFEIWCLMQQGRSISDIGRIFGVSRQRVHQKLESVRSKIQVYLSRN